jgi:hypothetical protein
MTMRVMRWHPNTKAPTPVDHEHECMNWDQIEAWAQERYVDPATPGLLIHPTKGEYRYVLEMCNLELCVCCKAFSARNVNVFG